MNVTQEIAKPHAALRYFLETGDMCVSWAGDTLYLSGSADKGMSFDAQPDAGFRVCLPYQPQGMGMSYRHNLTGAVDRWHVCAYENHGRRRWSWSVTLNEAKEVQLVPLGDLLRLVVTNATSATIEEGPGGCRVATFVVDRIDLFDWTHIHPPLVTGDMVTFRLPTGNRSASGIFQGMTQEGRSPRVSMTFSHFTLAAPMRARSKRRICLPGCTRLQTQDGDAMGGG